MPKILVSICIPAYKETALIKEALESIAIQSYTEYEVIITDDTPDDSVSEIVNQFYSKIKNLKYFKNSERLGSPKNWNECLNRAFGEYIKIIHHDDKFSSALSLQEFVNIALENPGAEFFFSSIKSFDVKKGLEYSKKPNKNKISKLKTDPLLLLTGNIIGAPSVTFFKRTEEKFDENLKWLVDIDFYIRMLKKPFVFINKPLMTVSFGGSGQVTNECQNKEIEFGEWFYLHRKYKSGKIPNLREIWHLLKLSYKYIIKPIFR